MIANPPIGATVRGADAHGRQFEAVVVRHIGSATVVLSDGFATPISLIREVVSYSTVQHCTAPADALDLGSWEDEAPATCQYCGRSVGCDCYGLLV